MTAAHEQVKNGNAMRFIKEYWFILVFIGTIAVGYVKLQAAVVNASDKNDKQDISIIKNADDLNELDKKYIEDVTTIKSELKFISEKLKNLK